MFLFIPFIFKSRKHEKKGTTKAVSGIGILAAFGASLCCITPLLALLAGTGGIASSFSWMEPFRPYLIGLVAATLAFAWYSYFKGRRQICTEESCNTEKKSFLASSSLLGMVMLASLLLLFFPIMLLYFTLMKKNALLQQAERKLFKQPLFKLKA